MNAFKFGLVPAMVASRLGFRTALFLAVLVLTLADVPLATQAQTLPNLAPYQPQGWSDPLVVSTTTGNHSADSIFYDDQDLYVDWACYNSTSISAGAQFMVKIFVDGTNRVSWNVNSLNGNSYTSYSDYKIGKLAAGAHQIQFDVDTASAITESNEADNSIVKTITVKSRLTPLSIVTTSPLVSAIVGTAYTNTLQATGGTPPYTWSVITSNPPAPLNLNPASGLLGGTPTNEASSTFTVKVTDAVNAFVTKSFVLTVLSPAANPNLLLFQKNGWNDRIVVATNQNQIADALEIFDDQETYVNWVVKNETLTAATNSFDVQLFVDSQLKQTWTVSGLAALAEAATTNLNIGKLTAGTHRFRVLIDGAGAVFESNENDNEFTKDFTILQRPNPPAITAQNPLPTGMKGLQYNFFMTAEGGVPPYTWSISGGVLPTGVILDPLTGEIRGAPTQDGNFSIKIKVTGTNGFSSESSFEMAINPTSPVANLRFYTVPGWSNSVLLSLTAQAKMDSTNIFDDEDVYLSWSVVNESPAVDVIQKISCRLYVDNVRVQEWSFNGLNASSETHLTGYNMGPLNSGVRTIKMVIDPLNSIVEYDKTDNTITKTVDVSHNPNPLTIVTDAMLPDGTNGYPYSVILEAINGTSPRVWSLQSGVLPSGMSFNTNSGAIQGTPTVAGYFPFRIQVADANGKHQQKNFELNIELKPDLPNLTPYKPYNWSAPLVFTTTNGSRLHMETAYDDEELFLNWTVLNNGYSMPVTNAFKIQLYEDGILYKVWTNAPDLGPAKYNTLEDFGIGKLFSGTYEFRLVVDSENAVFESDETDNIYTNSITILARLPAPAIVSPSNLPDATNGVAYSFALAATGGASPYTWTLMDGSMPPGLTLATNTGILSGKPTTASNYSFRIRVAGANRLYSEQVFNLSVKEPLLAPAIVTAPQSQNVVEGAAASFTVVAIGTQPLSYQWLKDGKPVTDNERISGSATPSLVVSNAQFLDAGKYSVTVGNVVKTIASPEAELSVLHPPVALSVQLYAGLMVTGSIGSSIEIQCTPDLLNTNQWLVLTNIVLPANPFLYIDTNSPLAPKRYYRAVTKN